MLMKDVNRETGCRVYGNLCTIQLLCKSKMVLEIRPITKKK